MCVVDRVRPRAVSLSPCGVRASRQRAYAAWRQGDSARTHTVNNAHRLRRGTPLTRHALTPATCVARNAVSDASPENVNPIVITVVLRLLIARRPRERAILSDRVRAMRTTR